MREICKITLGTQKKKGLISSGSSEKLREIFYKGDIYSDSEEWGAVWNLFQQKDTPTPSQIGSLLSVACMSTSK